MADTALHLTEATFDEEVGKHQNVLMVDFWAEWCAPCRAIAPTLEELARESGGKISLAKVNVDAQPGLAARYGIRSIPTMAVFSGGREVTRAAGARPAAEIERFVEQATQTIPR